MADAASRAGARYDSPAILEFVNTLHAPHDAALAAAFGASETEGLPPIQVGPSEGKLLGLLLRLIGAQKVVEIGTLAGYSAIHLGRGLAPGGHLWSLEMDPRHAAIAGKNLALAGLADQATILVGPALSHLPGLAALGPFDAVFIDADKGNYDHYGRWAAANMRPGGLLLGDNAYYFGRLLDDDQEAAAMRRFHQETREAFDSVCIPTPDGLLLGIRK